MSPAQTVSLKALKKHSLFSKLIKKHGPPDFSRRTSKDVFQSLLRAIVYQQLSGKAAATIHSRVLSLMDDEPTPQKLLKLSVHKLRAAGLSIQKIGYVRDLAEKCLDGTIDDRAFKRMSSEEIIAHLRQIRGVGEWTAHMLLIFTLKRPDILPTGDLGIRKGFQIIYGLRSLPEKQKMEQLAREWREHASIASWYFWRAADEAKRKSK